jgi:hypothetical protein
VALVSTCNYGNVKSLAFLVYYSLDMSGAVYSENCECGNDKPFGQVGCDECRAIEDRRWLRPSNVEPRTHKKRRNDPDIARMLVEGKSYTNIMAKYGISAENVADIGRKHGLPPRRKNTVWRKHLY